LRTYSVKVAAWLEILVGIGLIVSPDLLGRLLFAAPPDGVGVPMTRFAGIGLFSLGISCLSMSGRAPNRSAVVGLLVFNAAAAILLVWIGAATAMRGPLLWPAAILHAGLAAALLAQVSRTGALAV
jgi:hypothetical protein